MTLSGRPDFCPGGQPAMAFSVDFSFVQGSVAPFFFRFQRASGGVLWRRRFSCRFPSCMAQERVKGRAGKWRTRAAGKRGHSCGMGRAEGSFIGESCRQRNTVERFPVGEYDGAVCPGAFGKAAGGQGPLFLPDRRRQLKTVRLAGAGNDVPGES